jgi:hypothetical protein
MLDMQLPLSYTLIPSQSYAYHPSYLEVEMGNEV